MNTINSTIYGKAYEYACILALQELVRPYRSITIEDNESYRIAKQYYENGIDASNRKEMRASALSGIRAIMEMEPRILEDGKDCLAVSIQPDTIAKTSGDIRDVLIIRRKIKWEIGISVKHNHAALKHSRLSQHIDFGKEWLGKSCSQNYFKEINPIFDFLMKKKKENIAWKDIKNKEDKVYIPILRAFIKEFLSLQSKSNVTSKLINYLVGSNDRDYYKLIHNNNHTVTIMPFNLGGGLNLPAKNSHPSIKIPPIKLPNRIIELTFKEGSKTTIVLTMNNGWSISFRIHNASTKVEPSLKFDIQLQSKPEKMFYLSRKW